VFEIGSSLRTAREQRKLELADVEQATHIRTKYLRALEDERFDVLPGPAYVKGFLRTYADHLGLDGQRFLEEYNSRFPPADPLEAAPLVRVRPRRRLLDARLVLIPVAVAIGLFVWRTASGGGQEKAASVPTPVHVAANTVTRGPPAPPPPPPRRTARLDLVATRGPCWLSVRLGSDSGRVLYERTLEAGQRARFVANRLWLRIGAPWNVDATLNGRREQLPTALANILVTPQALRVAGG
jgi:Helix-turn-helix domain/RodZ C-terminal domain